MNGIRSRGWGSGTTLCDLQEAPGEFQSLMIRSSPNVSSMYIFPKINSNSLLSLPLTSAPKFLVPDGPPAAESALYLFPR